MPVSSGLGRGAVLGGACAGPTSTVTSATALNQTAGSTKRRRPITLFPELEKPAIEPVPQEIHQPLGPPFIALVQRNADAARHRDVLNLRQRDLKLRHEIPLGNAAFGPRPQDLELGRPLASKPAVLRDRRADGRPEVRFLVAFF